MEKSHLIDTRYLKVTGTGIQRVRFYQNIQGEGNPYPKNFPTITFI